MIAKSRRAPTEIEVDADRVGMGWIDRIPQDSMWFPLLFVLFGAFNLLLVKAILRYAQAHDIPDDSLLHGVLRRSLLRGPISWALMLVGALWFLQELFLG